MSRTRIYAGGKAAASEQLESPIWCITCSSISMSWCRNRLLEETQLRVRALGNPPFSCLLREATPSGAPRGTGSRLSERWRYKAMRTASPRHCWRSRALGSGFPSLATHEAPCSIASSSDAAAAAVIRSSRSCRAARMSSSRDSAGRAISPATRPDAGALRRGICVAAAGAETTASRATRTTTRSVRARPSPQRSAMGGSESRTLRSYAVVARSRSQALMRRRALA